MTPQASSSVPVVFSIIAMALGFSLLLETQSKEAIVCSAHSQWLQHLTGRKLKILMLKTIKQRCGLEKGQGIHVEGLL